MSTFPSPQETYHVIPHPRGWAVKRQDAKKPSRVFEGADARESARDWARKRGKRVVLHRDSGIVQKVEEGEG